MSFASKRALAPHAGEMATPHQLIAAVEICSEAIDAELTKYRLA
jgi:hypothetical protein